MNRRTNFMPRGRTHCFTPAHLLHLSGLWLLSDSATICQIYLPKTRYVTDLFPISIPLRSPSYNSWTACNYHLDHPSAAALFHAIRTNVLGMYFTFYSVKKLWCIFNFPLEITGYRTAGQSNLKKMILISFCGMSILYFHILCLIMQRD